MGIEFEREEYTAALPDWKLVDDMVDEKNLADHLLELNPTDKSKDNKARNKAYKERASFLGASWFTLQGLIGLAFAKEPKLIFPAAMDYLRKNADGGGTDLYQQMQSATNEVLRKDRAGLFVTFPETDGPITLADQEALRYVSTIHLIDATRITNWWTVSVGAESRLGGVVFNDSEDTVDDYKVETVATKREIALEDGILVDRKWHKDGGKWVVLSESFPRGRDGKSLTFVPFMFIGSQDNTPNMGKPPMLSLARKNRDHYRNSADSEESIWFAGQAQPWASGLDQETVEAWKKEGVYVGSRKVMALGENGKFGFATAEVNTGVRQAMLDKVEEMASIGARFIQSGTVAKTATQSDNEAVVQHSVLSLVSVNVEDAYQTALEWAAMYQGATGDVEVTLNRDFMKPAITVELMREFREWFFAGLLGTSEIHAFGTRAEIIDPDKSVEDYDAEVTARGGNIAPPPTGETE